MLTIQADTPSVTSGGSIELTVAGECAGELIWSAGKGSLQVAQDGLGATWTAAALDVGDLIDVVDIEVACSTDGDAAITQGVQVLGDEDMPVTGRARAALEPLDEMMFTLMERHGIPGATLGVSLDGEILLMRGYGTSDENQAVPMESCTPMRIASVTKPMTRAAFRRVEEDGDISQDDRLLDVLGDEMGISGNMTDHPVPAEEYDFAQWSYNAGCDTPLTGQYDPMLDRVDMEDVVNHTSGLATNRSSQNPNLGDPPTNPRWVANVMGLENSFSRDAMADVAGGACLVHDPADGAPEYISEGTKYVAYSNLGFSILGQAIEKASGRPYQDLLVDDVFGEVGIEVSNSKIGHALYHGSGPHDEVPAWEPYYFSDRADAGDSNGLVLVDGTWEHGPDVAAPYKYLFDALVAVGDQVANTRTLLAYMKHYRITDGRLREGDYAVADASHSGSIAGTAAHFWINDKASDTATIPSCEGEDLELETVEVQLPKGIAVAMLFNKEVETDPAGCTTASRYNDDIRLAVGAIDSWDEIIPLSFEQAEEGCYYCGNGNIQGSESCEGDDLAGETCASLGWDGGALGCTIGCYYDYTDCTGDSPFAPTEYGECLSQSEQEDCQDLGAIACAEKYGDRDCPGGPCRPTDPWDRDPQALADFFNAEQDSAYHPDGDFRDSEGGLYYCRDDEGDMTCVDDRGWSRCVRCGHDPGRTMIGCPCQDPDECFLEPFNGEPMTCIGAEFGGAGPGICGDPNAGLPSWMCQEAGCGMESATSLYPENYGGDSLYCEHYSYDGNGDTAGTGVCQAIYACSDGIQALMCSDDQLICDPTSANNVDPAIGCLDVRCDEDDDCDEGYPNDYTCQIGQCLPQP
jgi:CubicO group peptidase (beta-lactamase class C family)